MAQDTIKIGSRTFRVQVERDNDTGEPWKEHDGHGPVSEWTTRDKAPGELVLAEDRNSKRYYDFAEATRTAKRDGWDTAPYGQGTPGQRAARAVMADYEHLRAWCRDEWEWVGVIVTCEDETESLWGIESDDDTYIDSVAMELATEITRRLDKEAEERTYWAARDVVTTSNGAQTC